MSEPVEIKATIDTDVDDAVDRVCRGAAQGSRLVSFLDDITPGTQPHSLTSRPEVSQGRACVIYQAGHAFDYQLGTRCLASALLPPPLLPLLTVLLLRPPPAARRQRPATWACPIASMT